MTDFPRLCPYIGGGHGLHPSYLMFNGEKRHNWHRLIDALNEGLDGTQTVILRLPFGTGEGNGAFRLCAPYDHASGGTLDPDKMRDAIGKSRHRIVFYMAIAMGSRGEHAPSVDLFAQALRPLQGCRLEAVILDVAGTWANRSPQHRASLAALRSLLHEYCGTQCEVIAEPAIQHGDHDWWAHTYFDGQCSAVHVGPRTRPQDQDRDPPGDAWRPGHPRTFQYMQPDEMSSVILGTGPDANRDVPELATPEAREQTLIDWCVRWSMRLADARRASLASTNPTAPDGGTYHAIGAPLLSQPVVNKDGSPGPGCDVFNRVAAAVARKLKQRGKA